MKKKITILPGDGIGKEVTACGKKVLEQIAECFGHPLQGDGFARPGSARDQTMTVRQTHGLGRTSRRARFHFNRTMFSR